MIVISHCSFASFISYKIGWADPRLGNPPMIYPGKYCFSCIHFVIKASARLADSRFRVLIFLLSVPPSVSTQLFLYTFLGYARLKLLVFFGHCNNKQRQLGVLTLHTSNSNTATLLQLYERCALTLTFLPPLPPSPSHFSSLAYYSSITNNRHVCASFLIGE